MFLQAKQAALSLFCLLFSVFHFIMCQNDKNHLCPLKFHLILSYQSQRSFLIMKEAIKKNIETGCFKYTLDMKLNQEYEHYTAEDSQVWKHLFERQMRNLPGKASRVFLEGLGTVEFTASKIPYLEDTSEILKQETNWQIEIVPGLIPNREFFKLMSKKRFCSSTWLRSMEQLDYLEEPDMFHDAFGHIPLLTHQAICDFLLEISRIACEYIDYDAVLEAMARLYWYTIEFGLIRESEGLRIYGAGILSSRGETNYALFSDQPKRVPYDIKTILHTPYINDRFQEKYFILESFDELSHSMTQLEEAIQPFVEREEFQFI